MKIKESKSYKVFKFFNIIVLSLIAIISLYPMIYVLLASLSDPTEFMKHQGLLLKPVEFSFESYVQVSKHPFILSGYKSTLFVLIVGLAVNMLFTLPGAFALASKDFKYRALINKMVVFTMLFSGGMVPLFLTVKAYGLLDSYWALILPVAVNTFNLIIMRTAFSSIPPSLAESATLDGASELVIMLKIALPLCMPTIAVIILYYGVQHWNAWFHAMLFIKTKTKYPLQLVLREVLVVEDTTSMTIGGDDTVGLAETVKYAVIIVSTLPILALYPFLQRYFVKGVMVGAVKG